VIGGKSDALVSEWFSATTGGPRDLVFASGRVVHDGREDAAEQTLRLAMEASAKRTVQASGQDRPAACFIAVASAEPEAADDFERFFSVCGRTTLAAILDGFSPLALAACDSSSSFAFVEEMFSYWPALVGPVLGRPSEHERRFEGDVRPDMVLKAAGSLFANLHGAGSGQHVGVAGALIAYARLTIRDLQEEAVSPAIFCGLRAGADPGHGDSSDGAAPADADALAAFAAALRPERVAALLKRLRVARPGNFQGERWKSAIASMPALVRTLALASAVPPDWLPRDLEELCSFASVADHLYPIVRDSRGAVGYGALTASSKGRWADFLLRLDSGVLAESRPSDVRDMVAAFRAQCAMPALLQALTLDQSGARRDPMLRSAVGDAFAAHGSPPDRPVLDATVTNRMEPACWKLLFAAQSAPAVLESSALWHKAAPVMNATIGTLSTNEWQSPFDPMEIGDGVRLVPIRSSTELAEEGASLRHCVGGSSYVDGCMSGSMVIGSIRRSNADGTEVPTSTVHFTGWQPGRPWRPRVVQHQGYANGDPSGDDAHDLEVALDLIATLAPTPARPEPAPRPLPRDPRALVRDAIEETRERLALGSWSGAGRRSGARIDPVTGNAGYDWLREKPMQIAFVEWSRFLARGVRASGVKGFVRHFEAEAEADLMATMRSRVAKACESYRPPGALSVAMLTPGVLMERIFDTRALRPVRAVLTSRWWLTAGPAAVGAGLAAFLFVQVKPPATAASSAPLVTADDYLGRIAMTQTYEAARRAIEEKIQGSKSLPTIVLSPSSDATQPPRAAIDGEGRPDDRPERRTVAVAPPSSTESTLTVTAGTGTWTRTTTAPDGVSRTCSLYGANAATCSIGGTGATSYVVTTFGGGSGGTGTIGNPQADERMQLVRSLLDLVAKGGGMCKPDGSPATDLARNGMAAVKVWDKVRYPCAKANDMLVIADGERLSVYLDSPGAVPKWVFGSRGTDAQHYDGAWANSNDRHRWAAWIQDRLHNGALMP
jgi:hypothetical protein